VIERELTKALRLVKLDYQSKASALRRHRYHSGPALTKRLKRMRNALIAKRAAFRAKRLGR
jgi:hypothetical protein